MNIKVELSPLTPKYGREIIYEVHRRDYYVEITVSEGRLIIGCVRFHDEVEIAIFRKGYLTFSSQAISLEMTIDIAAVLEEIILRVAQNSLQPSEI